MGIFKETNLKKEPNGFLFIKDMDKKYEDRILDRKILQKKARTLRKNLWKKHIICICFENKMEKNILFNKTQKHHKN